MSQDTEAETLVSFIERMGLSMVATFQGAGPARSAKFSAKAGDTHWALTISRGGRLMHTEYHMGAAYWRWKRTGEWGVKGARVEITRKLMAGSSLSLWGEEILRTEAEPIPPDLPIVLDSLRSDAEGSDCAFEEWASYYGYDADSRKAEEIYRACVKERHMLLGLLGPDGFAELLRTERL